MGGHHNTTKAFNYELTASELYGAPHKLRTRTPRWFHSHYITVIETFLQISESWFTVIINKNQHCRKLHLLVAYTMLHLGRPCWIPLNVYSSQTKGHSHLSDAEIEQAFKVVFLLLLLLFVFFTSTVTLPEQWYDKYFLLESVTESTRFSLSSLKTLYLDYQF